MPITGKILVAQGGGPTAVINQTLAGIVLEARKFPQVTKIYGAVNGVEGIVNEAFLDLTQETTHNLEQVALTPGSALKSTRVKPDKAFCRRIFEVLRAHDIRWFFYIGGNDSASTVQIVNAAAQEAKYDLQAIHVPKTIDNDLVLNDHTPGYGSAARFVAQAFMGVNQDTKALAGIYIGIVMGRNAGFLTAAASLAQIRPEDGPHLIYLPEREFDLARFCADVKAVYERLGRCVVAVSEGICDKSGTPMLAALQKNVEYDAHGNLSLSGTGALGDMLVAQLKEKLNIKRVRCDTFGYLQRSFCGCVSDVDQHEAREAGEQAVQIALSQQVSGSLAIQRTGDYAVDYRLVPLAEVAAKTKLMPDEFISPAGNHVTDAFRRYARPLLGTALPSPAVLRAPVVEKILNKEE